MFIDAHGLVHGKRRGGAKKGSTPLAIPMTPFTYSPDFQLRILRTLHQEPDFAQTVGLYLKPGCFDDSAKQWVAEQVLTYAHDNGHGISQDALVILAERQIKAGELKGPVVEEIADILDTLESPVLDRSFIKDEVFRFTKHQATKGAILQTLPLLDLGDYEEIDRILGQVTEISALSAGGLGRAFFRKEEMAKRARRRKNYVPDGVPSGLKVDEHLKAGGLPPKTLGVILAPTNRGKSHILVHIGASAIVESCRKERVLHVTLELGEEHVEDRYDAWFSKIANNDLERVPNKVHGVVSSFAKRYGDCLRIKEFPSGALTVQALRAYIRQLERTGFYPTLIIVDYADEMADSTPHIRMDDTYILQGNIFRGLRGLAGELKVPIWTATQTNKSGLKLELIDLDSIGESYVKAKVADLVVAWCQTEDEYNLSKGRLYIAKSRLGPTRIEMNARCDWSRSRIINL